MQLFLNVSLSMNIKSAVYVSQVLSGNCRLLFHKDSLCREEAATRLLWLTKPSQPHKRLADICLLDVAVTGHTPVTGMYEVQFDYCYEIVWYLLIQY